MRFPAEIFLLLLSSQQLTARSIRSSGDQSKNIYDTSFFDSFHELFGFYEVPPPTLPQVQPPANGIAAEEAARIASEKAAAAEAARIAAEATARIAAKAAAEEVARIAAEKAAAEEAARIAVEEAAAADAARMAAEEAAAADAARIAAEAAAADAARIAAEETAAAKATRIASEEAAIIAAEEAAAVKAARIAAEEAAAESAARIAAEEEAARLSTEEALRIAAEEAARVASAKIEPIQPPSIQPVNPREFNPVLEPVQPPFPVVHKPVQPHTAIVSGPSQPAAPIVSKPVQPTVPVVSKPANPPTQSSNPAFAPPIPNKPSLHPNQPSKPWWSGAPQRPYFTPPRPFGPQPWWRQPSPPPTTPRDFNTSHPSQPKYIPADQAIPNKVKDIKVGIPNKTPDLRPARPLPPFHMEPSPFPLPREECITAQGELGECASHFQCGQQGGRPRGLCHLGHDVSAHARTCCVYPSFCGYQTNRELTYFKNPNYPNITTHLGDCLYRVNLLPGVCQVRVDFMNFLMKPMKNGDCESDNSLIVTSNDENAYIPVQTFCGLVASGEHDPLKTDIAHIYVNVDDDLPVDRPKTKRYLSKTVDFRVKIQNHPTRWNLRISQIQCDGANLQAPLGCAQYYNQNKGNITSLNYLDGAYANNMDLALCIKRDPAACAIHYRIHTMGVGPTKGGVTGKTQLGYGLTCDDYLIFNGERTAICGSVSKGPKDIILPVKGEQGLAFHTDSIHIPKADVGFHIEYEYIHNCNGLEFYKYPTAGRKN